MNNSVLYINKPKSMSSFDVCFKLRKVLNTKKIGHTGTLDPNATGVMVILYDNCTKANQFLVSQNKTYTTRVLYGVETDSLDIDGNIINKQDYTCPSKDELINVLNTFKGQSKQVVPLTSAVKVDGKRLYQYQLEGKEVALPIRDINVYSIELNEVYDDGFTFTCKVSSGTYIRALVRDILSKLHVIGTVKDLIRTNIDSIDLNDCDNFDEVLKGNYHKHDLLDILAKRYKVIDYANEKDILNGKRIKLDCEEEMVVITHNGKLLAMYGKDNDVYRSIRGLW